MSQYLSGFTWCLLSKDSPWPTLFYWLVLSGPAGVCWKCLLFHKCGHITEWETACELLVSPWPTLWAALPLCPFGEELLGDLERDPVEGHKLTGRKVLRSGGDLCSWEHPSYWLSFQLVPMTSNTSAEKKWHRASFLCLLFTWNSTSPAFCPFEL